MNKLLIRIAPLAAAVAASACGGSTGKARAPGTDVVSKNATSRSHHHYAPPVPKHLPGGDNVTLPWSTTTPPQTTLLNTFFPGPANTPGFDGPWVEPSTIFDFSGAFVQVYLGGTAADRDGKNYFVEVDARAFQGSYIGADGRRAHGTFCEI